jgi:hypothetical protein
MPLYLLLGTVFGFILSRSGAADYGFIQGMFLFTELQLYGVIGVAVIGEGKVYALAALAGALAGAGLLGSFYPVVQRSFGLPQLKAGTGEG